MFTTIKFRLYPNRSQIAQLEGYFRTSCIIYNQAIEQRIHAVRADGGGFTYYDQAKQLTIRRSIEEGIRSVPARIGCDGLRRADDAFRNFFRRCRQGARKKGFPRFKSVSRWNSFSVSRNREFVSGGRLKVEGIKKTIRIRGFVGCPHKPTRLTIVRRGRKWFGRILIDDQTASLPKHDPTRKIGLTPVAHLKNAVRAVRSFRRLWRIERTFVSAD